jgi:hypothetical protein
LPIPSFYVAAPERWSNDLKSGKNAGKQQNKITITINKSKYHENIVATSGSNFQGAFDVFLPFDFGEIQVITVVLCEELGKVHLGWRDFDLAFQTTGGAARRLGTGMTWISSLRRLRQPFPPIQGCRFCPWPKR